MLNILILCTGNSARSILGEALLNTEGAGRIKAFSAGSTPTGTPNPNALELLSRRGIDTAFARSKSWDEFSAPDAPALDLVITVCDNAANEACPYWPGGPISVHWGIPDPAAASPEHAQAAFEKAERQLLARIKPMLALPLEDLSPKELQNKLLEIGNAAEKDEL